MADFLRLTETEMIPFSQNYATKLAVWEPTLVTITPAHVVTANTLAIELPKAINAVNSIREDAKEYTNVKNILLYSPLGTALPGLPTATAWPAFGLGTIAGFLAWYRDNAALVKADPLYTIAIGQDLAIIGTGDAPGIVPPVLGPGFALPGYNCEMDWNKAGHQAVRLRSQRGAEVVWTEIGTDMSPPFIDNRPPLVFGPPEERRYQAAYVDNDAISTDWSATLTIVAHS
ncbi:MAG: hypothetical protein WAO58_10165 [Fimbriimonadaceae bacterium]